MGIVLAKFKCTSVKEVEGGQKYVELQATSGAAGDNKDFTDYTPSGKIEIMIAAGAPAQSHFAPGKKYFIQFDETAD